MKSIVERLLIKILKKLKTDLLSHAHVQIGAGHNSYHSGEKYVIDNLIFKILKKEPEIIFDVGANVGEYAKLLANRFINSVIYCFEPIPKNYAFLVQNTAELRTINTLTALGSHNGHVKLYMGDDNTDGSMATLYKETLTDIFSFVGEINQVIESPVTTLDDFCEKIKIKKIDFIKIDVEGHELEVLKGALNMINNNNISIIQFEFNEFNIFSKSFIWDFYQILKDYDLYRIMPQNKLYRMGVYNSSLEIFRYQNILSVHHSLNYVC